MSKIQYIPCPFCKATVEINISWAIRNGRVFCNSCCKSFDIRVGEETEDEPPKKEEQVEDRTKEKFDKAVEEHFENISDTNDDYWDTF